MIGHGHAAFGHVFRQRRQTGAILLERVGGQPRAAADGRLPRGLHAAGRFGIDHDRRAQRPECRELPLHALLFPPDGTLQQAARKPAGDKLQPVRGEEGTKLGGIHRKLAAGFRSAEAGGAALLQAGFQRRVAAELRQVVVGPRNRRDAEAYRHGRMVMATLRCAASSCPRRAGPQLRARSAAR